MRIERPDNRDIHYTYNSGGQLSQISLERGTTHYQYQTQSDQPTQITAPDGNILNYQWDGSLPIGQSWQGDISGSVTHSWNNQFWLSQRCVNTSHCIDFGYDDDGLLTQAGSLTLTRHENHGLVTGATLGTLNHNYSYNAFGERISTAITRNGNSLGSLNYSHDKLGRITTRTENLGGSSFTDSYQYDLAGRLTQITRNGETTTWSYDDNGNRTHENGQLIASYDEQDRLLSYQGTSYQYTANGELTSKTESGVTTHYEYDELGNLLQVQLPGDITIDYLIDGQNRRIGKKVNGSITQGFLYQDQLNPVAELDGNGNVISHFIYADQPNVPAYMIKGGNTYQIISDHLGSPRVVINTATGEVAQRLTYDVWGNITEDTNPGFQPFGFAGGIYDQHTQLTRFGARDYDARTGRWTVKDPIGFAGGDFNLYGYVLNDPVNLVDPYGLCVPPFLAGIISGMVSGAITGGIMGMAGGPAGVLMGIAGGAVAGAVGGFFGSSAAALAGAAAGGAAGGAIGAAANGGGRRGMLGAAAGGSVAGAAASNLPVPAGHGVGGLIGGAISGAAAGGAKGGYAGAIGGAVGGMVEAALTGGCGCGK